MPPEGKPAPPLLLPHDALLGCYSRGFFFENDRTHHPRYRMAMVTELYYYDLQTGATAPVDLGSDPRGLAEIESGACAPTADGFVALLADGVHVLRLARFTRTGRGFRRQDLTGGHAANLDSLEIGRDGRTVVYQASSATEPPQGYAAKLMAPA